MTRFQDLPVDVLPLVVRHAAATFREATAFGAVARGYMAAVEAAFPVDTDLYRELHALWEACARLESLPDLKAIAGHAAVAASGVPGVRVDVASQWVTLAKTLPGDSFFKSVAVSFSPNVFGELKIRQPGLFKSVSMHRAKGRAAPHDRAWSVELTDHALLFYEPFWRTSMAEVVAATRRAADETVALARPARSFFAVPNLFLNPAAITQNALVGRVT